MKRPNPVNHINIQVLNDKSGLMEYSVQMENYASYLESKLAAFDAMKEALEEIIDAQFNPSKSLANLNGAISNARDLLTNK